MFKSVTDQVTINREVRRAELPSVRVGPVPAVDLDVLHLDVLF